MLAIRLSPEIEAELVAAAKQTGQSKTALARQAILNFLEDLEDARIADKAMEAFEKSGRKTIPFAEVLKRYGMDN